MYLHDHVGYFQTKDLELMFPFLAIQVKSDGIAPGDQDNGGIMAWVPIFNDENWLFRAVLANASSKSTLFKMNGN